MNEIFRLRVNNRAVRCQNRLNLISYIISYNISYKTMESFGPNIWNALPPHIKSCKNFETFKRVKKTRMCHYL